MRVFGLIVIHQCACSSKKVFYNHVLPLNLVSLPMFALDPINSQWIKSQPNFNLVE